MKFGKEEYTILAGQEEQLTVGQSGLTFRYALVLKQVQGTDTDWPDCATYWEAHKERPTERSPDGGTTGP